MIDYIGNHQNFLLKPQFLFNLSSGSLALRKILQDLRQGTVTAHLPPGCEVTYDPAAVDLLEAFVRLRSDNLLDAFYSEFLEIHGRRPLALEAYQSRVNPGAASKSHGSWIGYVVAHSGVQVSEAQREFLAHLEGAEMTKSYKMVLLQAMIHLGAFPGPVPIDDLTREFARLMARSARLTADLSEDVHNLTALRRLVIKNPVAAWSGGKYFAYENGFFRSLVQADSALTLEIADWCLARYLDRSRGPICKLIQATGGKPIVKLHDKLRGQLPEGKTPLWTDGVEYEADFVKIYLNVIRPVGGGENVLPEVLRGWFGAGAGSNGSRHEVQFELRDGRWTMEPAP